MAADRPTERPLVLVVDDCADLREGCALACRGAGYPTIEAGTADEALQQAVRHRPEVVILDLMLPGIPGWDVARLLKLDPRTRAVRIVIMSGSIDRVDALCTRDAEAVLRKPFGTAALLECVNSLVSGDDSG
jgi:CheY-like chemotaxis protein